MGGDEREGKLEWMLGEGEEEREVGVGDREGKRKRWRGRESEMKGGGDEWVEMGGRGSWNGYSRG